MSLNHERPHPPAREEDILRCETAMGAVLPTWLPLRLLAENGWRVDDRNGATGEEWRFLPVLDRTDRKRMSATAEDIAHHTLQLRAAPHLAAGMPPGVVVVARAWHENTRLVLLPDPADPARLGDALYRQNGVALPLERAFAFETIGRKPQPARGSHLRPGGELPAFRYHPDPVATGAVEAAPDAVCPCCGLSTGWAYCMQPYGAGNQPDHLCPWCIADGSAAARFGSEFVSDFASGEVPKEVVAEINLRTPGYLSWQGERWQVCCGDAAVFLGSVGWDRLQTLPDAQAAIVEDGWGADALPAMHADGDLSAYLFRCRHCGRHLAHADAS
jgi:hypothetical protein